MKQPNIVNNDTPQFVTWFAACSKGRQDYMVKNFPSIATVNGMPAEQLVVDVGSRYIKISNVGKSTNSVWAFVDRTNGDVLKPATWRAPAKHARGNIFDSSNGLSQMGPYGPAYIRGPSFGTFAEQSAA